jgi:hypothetical protein
MNALTRDDLKDFIQELLNFAYACSSISGTTALVELFEKGERIIEQLDSDPTIL